MATTAPAQTTQALSDFEIRRLRAYPELVPLGQMPEIVPGATWQPPYTIEHHKFRVYLNGEPVIGAIAAKAGAYGWVVIAAGEAQVGKPFAGKTTRFDGRVELRRKQG
jgi:hypothetical protein